MLARSASASRPSVSTTGSPLAASVAATRSAVGVSSRSKRTEGVADAPLDQPRRRAARSRRRSRSACGASSCSQRAPAVLARQLLRPQLGGGAQRLLRRHAHRDGGAEQRAGTAADHQVGHARPRAPAPRRCRRRRCCARRRCRARAPGAAAGWAGSAWVAICVRLLHHLGRLRRVGCCGFLRSNPVPRSRDADPATAAAGRTGTPVADAPPTLRRIRRRAATIR